MQFNSGLPPFGIRRFVLVQNPYGERAVETAGQDLSNPRLAFASIDELNREKQKLNFDRQMDLLDNGIIDGSILQGRLPQNAVEAYTGLNQLDVEDDGILNNSMLDRAYLNQALGQAASLADSLPIFEERSQPFNVFGPNAQEQAKIELATFSVQDFTDIRAGRPALGGTTITRQNLIQHQQFINERIGILQRLGGFIPDGFRQNALRTLNVIRQGGDFLLRNFNRIASQDGDRATISPQDLQPLIGQSGFRKPTV